MTNRAGVAARTRRQQRLVLGLAVAFLALGALALTAVVWASAPCGPPPPVAPQPSAAALGAVWAVTACGSRP